MRKREEKMGREGKKGKGGAGGPAEGGCITAFCFRTRFWFLPTEKKPAF
jgi:hypothetical protein